MRQDINKKTRLIVRRNGEYLVGKDMIRPCLRWSTSPYDAWHTRSHDKARKVARATGGIVILFNPIINKTQIL